MPLNFPNPSRSYEAGRHGVRFWGYDQSIEVLFLVTEGALRELQSDAKSEHTGFLEAFDAHRDRIHTVASKVYARGFRGLHTLGLEDFRRSDSGRTS